MADSGLAQRAPSGTTHAPKLADHSADRRMLVLMAMALVTGTGGAAAAWVLLKLIALVTNLIWYQRLSAESLPIAAAATGPLVLLAPVLGALAIGLMARFGSDKIRGHGIPEALEAILYGESRLSLKVALLKPISSAISIGSGGPFGAEGPIIMTGGAIGSLFAQQFRLTAAERKTLLVAGAAAGMTAIFGTPLAAILLAVEVMLFEWKPRSFVPVVASVLTALAWRPLLIGSGPLFAFTGTLGEAGPTLLIAALMGCIAGAVAALLSTMLYRIEDGFHRLPVHWMWWPAIGAVAVGIGGLIEPRVLGAGYNNIQDLLDGRLVLGAMMLLFAAKAVVWLIALGSGTSGGILAPLLIIGGAFGGILGHWLPGGSGPWAMIGMAAVMSASMRAPLTSAIFTVELTGHFTALPATVAASGAAFAVAVLVLKRSILTEKVSRRGRHISQEYSIDPLALGLAGDLMTPKPDTLPEDMTIAEALKFFEAGAKHRSYPVVDPAGRPIGLASRSDALRWGQGEGELDETIGEQLSDRSLPVATRMTPANQVANLMITENIGRICIVDSKTGKLLGIVARRDLLRSRAEHLRAERERSPKA
ncbi:putative chloride channel [Sphingomonas changbaiensis NBRC 104936]|uniref:Putative chloride channel n=1 Tax=Sphingomonas changbaiensis NBRC 104936 TaxID=1219043 RepID=A0A0E9MKN3_9SPHN|nr:chloride channel protein [Sphingomonas changbaiensis]GAO37966.1 putative chloride channel [Sphingomonas changbaiensis NBRC 104936]